MRRIILVLTTIALALIVGSGVAFAAVKFGAEGRDFIQGTDDPDVLYGRGGADGLLGRGGDDLLHGGNGDDYLFGGVGNDAMYGGAGDDFMGLGPDFQPDTGGDVLYGGSGNDELVAIEGSFIHPLPHQSQDIVFCGPGTDAVYYLKGVDLVSSDCEKKNPR